ncbi:hypothetical protein LPJ59_005434 [Coemansia sp. RSA 2399]|nr:hypothetical protein LPJ59_005434 [Coemansia sp. RSA 2399]KAJ1893936.1 hypothetical protein LPJ81_005268 [Coemansia sp. IMI 209127]
MAGCHEKKLARKAATTVYSQGNAPETKGSVIPEPVGVGIETQNIIDEQPPVGWTDKSNDTAAYGRNDNVKLKLNEDLEGERETLAKVEPETDSRQRGHRREQAPELVVEIEPKPGLILESEIETSLDVTKNKRRDSEYETTNDVEGSAARPGGVISGPARDYVNKTAPVTPTIDEQQLKNWKKNITMVWRELSGHRFGSMFIGPIKSADAPNYYDVIRKPMDLKTIKNRVRDEEITTTAEFYCDVMHMLMNALMYNAEDTEVYQMAMEFIPDAQACIEQLLQTEEEAVKHPAAASNGNGNGGGDMADSNMPGVDVLAGSTTGAAVRTEDDARSVEHHDEDDSDASSVPAKRRRRVASERASKHLRI